MRISRTSFSESSLTAGPCPVCGTVMATRYGMRRHFKVMHKRKETLSFCQLSYSLPTLEAEASYCKICNRKFLTTFAIQRHMRRVHPEERDPSLSLRSIDGENPIGCLFCGKSFSGKQSLDRHLRIVHQRKLA